jgi:transposase
MTNKPRYIEVDRTQTRWDFIDLDGMLPGDHRARIVWSFVESMDLSVLYAQINALEGEPGRPPPDPKVMLALWLYGTIEGVASARELCRLTHSDIAYRWLAGGVPLKLPRTFGLPRPACRCA